VSYVRTFLIGLGALIAVTASPMTAKAAADSACQPFLNVSFWGDLTHEGVIQYVDSRLGGNWNSFIDRLEQYQAKLEEAHSQAQAFTVSYQGQKISLEGQKLSVFKRASQWRLNIVKCLADEAQAEALGASLQEFATAAGGNDESVPVDITSATMSSKKPSAYQAANTSAVPEIQTGKVETASVNMRVESQCSAGVASFRVTNVGNDWPGRGHIKLFALDSGKPVQLSERIFRFVSGQNSTFKVRTDRVGAKNIALWIDPSWEQRDFAFDAAVNCR